MKIYVKYKHPRYETAINSGCLGCHRNYKCLMSNVRCGYIGAYELLYCWNWRIHIEGSH